MHKREFIDAFCEFLELAVHTILCVRGLYPQAIFERREKYGIPVMMSRHPVLNTYVRDSIESSKEWLYKDQVDRVSISVISKHHKILERYNFEITAHSAPTCEVTLEQAMEQLKAVIIRIQSFTRSAPPSDSTFTIEVHKKGEPAGEATAHWVPVDEHVVENAELNALKSLDLGVWKLQLFVETSSTPASH